MDVWGLFPDYGTNVQLYMQNNSTAQQWAIVNNGDSFYIISRCNGYALDTNGESTADGVNVIVYPYYGAAKQNWEFVHAEYTVSFDANGGNEAPANQIKYYNEGLTLSSDLPTRDGWYFLGWAESADATLAAYLPGDSFTKDVDTTLYAVWAQPDFVLPAALKEIDEEAFAGAAFSYVHVPEQVTKIGKRAFADCPNLRNIDIPAGTTAIDATAFEGVSDLTIHGAEGSYAEFYAGKHGFDFVAD